MSPVHINFIFDLSFPVHLSSVGQNLHYVFHDQIITVVMALAPAFLSLWYCLPVTLVETVTIPCGRHWRDVAYVLQSCHHSLCHLSTSFTGMTRRFPASDMATLFSSHHFELPVHFKADLYILSSLEPSLVLRGLLPKALLIFQLRCCSVSSWCL